MPEVRYHSARCDVSIWGGRISVTSLVASEPNKGHGTGLLKVVKKLAKKHNLPVVLKCAPFEGMLGAVPMSFAATFRFYENNGFTPKRFDSWNQDMFYDPRGLKYETR